MKHIAPSAFVFTLASTLVPSLGRAQLVATAIVDGSTGGSNAAPLIATDASAMASDASVASSDGAAANEPAAPSGACQSDPVPAGHEIRVETRITPAMPSVGDRVIITYRLFHRTGDSLEFDPDPVAFAQPTIEMEYAREQPDRDRRAHAGTGNQVYGEVMIAVQPFKLGDVAIAPQLARLNAAGDVIRVCTPEVRFRVRDPFGNDPHPRPRDVTGPEPVTEDALRARWLALALDVLFIVILATLIVSAYLRRRPKPVVPPPPPRPAWIVALEALDVIARGDMLSRGLTKDYYDAISDVVRRYVGAFCGFDALEMTSDEVLARMRRTPLVGVAPTELEHMLRECDLVKFARYVPTHEESEAILTQAYGIVKHSTPGSASRPGGGGAGSGSGGAKAGESTVIPASPETRRA